MASKLTGAAGAFVVMMGLSFVWHELIMLDFYSEIFSSIARPEPDMVLISAGYLVASLIMAHLYAYGFSYETPPLGQGLRFGATIGLLWWLAPNLVMAGAFLEQTVVQAVVDGVWHAVEGAAGGAVIALIHARSVPAETVPIEP